MQFIYDPETEFFKAEKNGILFHFHTRKYEPPSAEDCAFAERLADNFAAAEPRIHEYIFTHENFSSFVGSGAPLTPDTLTLDFIRLYGDDYGELWYNYTIPFKDHYVDFAVDVGFEGCFERFTDIFID